MKFQAPRGTEDVLPGSVETWQYLEQTFFRLAYRYGYAEIRTPVFEDIALFKATAGDTSDIVSKEMYEFKDKGDRDLALKPEGTAPVIRASIEHNLCPVGFHARLAYNTACYRYSRPTKGRLRELHQLGAEFQGSASPEADAEVIELAVRFFEEVGLNPGPISLNSIGRDKCRATYSEVILSLANDYLKQADPDVAARIRKNPLGMLDSKDQAQQDLVQTLPPILDYLEPESADRFERIQSLLSEAGIKFNISPKTVRGLGYYTETVFEYEHCGLPGLSIAGGGRYDDEFEKLGGNPTPSVGFGIGVERLILALEGQSAIRPHQGFDVFVVRADYDAVPYGREIARKLRALGLTVRIDTDVRSLKSQLKQAANSGAKFAIIVGTDEIAGDYYTVRNLAASSQERRNWQELLALLAG